MNETKISVVIPHVPSDYHDTLLDRAVASLKGHSEVIVVANMPYSIGFSKAVNIGLKLAKGDYIAVVNNDIVWDYGNLEDLCIPNVVTSPLLNGGAQFFWGCFFVIPRTVLEKVGLLDDQFFFYCSDTDYVRRIKDAGFEMRSVPTCNFKTKGGETMGIDPKHDEISTADHDKFMKKWGMMPDQMMSLMS